MSSIKEIIDSESSELSESHRDILHLHKEGSFYRAYDWSAFLACRYLHEFKVNKRIFKGVDQPVVFIGFPETSIAKWIPEGAEQTAVDEKHLTIRLPGLIFGGDSSAVLDAAYMEWKQAIPLSEPQTKEDKKTKNKTEGGYDNTESGVTLTSVMQRILAYPIESKSPLESMAFLADVKRQLAAMI